MNREKSVSFNTLMDKINPLNLKENYNDCVIAFKVLLNLSDNEEVRNLGQQITDSFLLLNLLNSNAKLKKYFPEYNVLCNKLYVFVNKYSQFEKLLRKSKVKTKAYLSTNDIELEKNILDTTNGYVFIESKDTDISYTLNDIINTTNLFRIILCKDKDEKFKKSLMDKIKISNADNNELRMSNDTKEIMKRKKNNLVSTIISDDDISDNQTRLFNLIEEKCKKLMFLDQKSYVLEKFLDETMTHLFVLDSNIAKKYAEFKALCKNEMEKTIKERQLIITELRNNFDEYEKNNKIEQVENSINDLSNEIDYNKVYANYVLSDNREYNDFDVFDFLEFVNYSLKKESFDSLDKHTIISNFKDIYSQYLVQKLGNENNSLNFKDFMKQTISSKEDTLLQKK